MSHKPSIVYVIEDDKSFLIALVRLIRAWECEVVGMETIEEFRNVFPLQDDGCLVVDLCLKGECGLLVLDELSANGAAMPIVFISATEDLEMVAKASAIEASCYLKKPFEANMLFETIERVMRDDVYNSTGSEDLKREII